VNLYEVLKHVVAEKETPISDATVDNWYTAAIADYHAHLDTEPTLDDLNREAINKWIDARVAAAKLSRATIKTRRGALLCLWRAAVELELLEMEPKRIRRVVVPRANPKAWTPEEVQTLFDYASKYSADRVLKNSLPSRVFWGSLIAAGYDTALRLGDVLSLERSQIRTDKDGTGVLRLAQQKNGRWVGCRLNVGTMQMIDSLLDHAPGREKIWPLWCRREGFYQAFRKLVSDSGISPGTFRFLRRSSATHVELLQPGRSSTHCGHADEDVTRKHYLDADQLAIDATTPGDLTRREPARVQWSDEPIIVGA
jgi:integrase